MASPYARKVDQQFFYLRQILDLLVAPPEGCVVPAFVQVGYLQLEMALRFYLFELTDKNGKGSQTLGMIDVPLIEQLLANAPTDSPSQDLVELADLARQPHSWLGIYIYQLRELRRVDLTNKLRGAIFQTEDISTDPASSAGNLIATSDVSSRPELANLADLNLAAHEFQQMVVRQRAVSEEF